jgi:hypothetical protein
MNIFFYPDDAIDEVREIRNQAKKALLTGQVVEWQSGNTSVKKVIGVDLEKVIADANEFLRIYDPYVRAKNPVRDISKPFIWL